MKTREEITEFEGDQAFHCLNGKTVMTAQVSDHYPVVHNNVLFWNVMMQGKARDNGFNNGFGIVETDVQYKNRLQQIAHVVNEICLNYKNIKVISLCEGPIDQMEEKFHGMVSKLPAIKTRFAQSGFLKPTESGIQWGLLTLIDKSYSVRKLDTLNRVIKKEGLNPLRNRAELLELKQINEGSVSYVALFHLPFGVIHKGVSSQFATELSHLSPLGETAYKVVKNLMTQYHDEDLTISGDFNFKPHLLESKENGLGFAIPGNNSTLFLRGQPQSVTVDGILVSQKNRQRIVGSLTSFGLFTQLKQEHAMANQVERQELVRAVRSLLGSA